MKRLLLSLLTLFIPAAHATNYVECEAIRAVISRNNIQQGEAKKNSKNDFVEFKINEKFPENNYIRERFNFCAGLDGKVNENKCFAFWDSIATFWNDTDTEIKSQYISEYQEFLNSKLEPYIQVNKRATNDLKKRGCYYF